MQKRTSGGLRRLRSAVTASPGVGTILFACPVDASLGIGHLARCSTVARELHSLGAQTSIICRDLPPAGVQHLFSRFDSLGERSWDRARIAAVVCDGVAPPVSSAEGFRLVSIDDGPPRPLDVDLVVNPNLTAEINGYTVTAGGEIYAGSRYALVDHAVVEAKSLVPPVRTRPQRILVTCGGSDPAGMTERYLQVAQAVAPSLELRIAVGPLNPRVDAIRALAAPSNAVVLEGLSSLAEEAAGADVALTTLGTTAAELACLGIPNLATAVAQIQVPFLSDYTAAGVLLGTGWHKDVDDDALGEMLVHLLENADRRRALREAGRTAVDGLGAKRTAAAIAALATRGPVAAGERDN